MQDSSICHNIVAGNESGQGRLFSVFPTKPAQVSSVQDLYKFICSGPLLEKFGLAEESIADSIDKWLAYGLHLCRLFQLNELYLNVPQKVRLYHYYIPVFLWCEDQISQHRSGYKEGEDIPPLVVHILLLKSIVHQFLLAVNLVAVLDFVLLSCLWRKLPWFMRWQTVGRKG